MGEGQLLQLLIGDLGQLLVGIAERGAPEPGHALDIILAGGVVDEDAPAALQHQRADLAMGGEVGVGVNEGLDVAHGEVGQHFPAPDVYA